MASLYTHRDSNIFRTWIYLIGFFLLVVGMGWVLSYAFDTYFIFVFAVVLAVVMNIGAYWYSDKLVVRLTRAQPLQRGDNLELYRLVENLSITAGLPMPKLYILHDRQPNAFATGRNPEHAVVAVTTGLLERLDRIELEGVLAHELAHVGNRDMLISTVAVVLVGIVILMADFFVRMAFWGGLGGNRGGPERLVLLGVAIAFVILAPLLAQMLKMAVSRRREFLADASGALLTRYPEGLARALEKISSDPNEFRHANDATAHLFFSNPFRKGSRAKWLHKLFMTHPPAEERIAALRGMKV